MIKIAIHEVITSENLLKAALRLANTIAFNRMKGFTRSYDNVIYWEFAQNIDRVIKEIQKSKNDYQFDPMLLYVKRVKTKTRRIFISTWRDKLVEILLNHELNKRLKGYYNKKSFAFRPDNIGINHCQRGLASTIKQTKFLSRRDIKDYFYQINHGILLNKLDSLLDEKLFAMVRQRIQFTYYSGDRLLCNSLGVPFGSSIAGLLANIYLTDLDNHVSNFNIEYFRYADDIIICGQDHNEVLAASSEFDKGIELLKLKLNSSKCSQVSIECEQPGFIKTNKIKFLGLEFNRNVVRLPLEKRRKVINFFKYELLNNAGSIKKIKNIDERLAYVVGLCNNVLLKKIRSVSIIDYYLNHITDQEQLKSIDRQIAEIVIATVLNKKFRLKDYKIISFKKLRRFGLPSLLHRSRLIRQGHIKVPFFSLYNRLLLERYEQALLKRKNKIRAIKNLSANGLSADTASRPTA